MTERYDLVLYGATGFAGTYVLEALAKLNDNQLRFAVAGRNENKLRAVLSEVADRADAPWLLQTPIIIADSSKPESLVEMAKQAKVIINVVGPYRLYGEAVVKAAVENGASHVDISGEAAFIERMVRDYGPIAEKNGVYIVGGCGFDSVPCDLGVTYLKKHFDGTLGYAETFVQLHTGPLGYSLNNGTYQTVILGISEVRNDDLTDIRKVIMPQKLEELKFKPPSHLFPLWYNDALQSYVLPFPGSDAFIVERSQYYDTTVNGRNYVPIKTYILVKSQIRAYFLMFWIAMVATMAQLWPTRKFLQKYPEFVSAGMFTENGPTRQQIKETSFTYWFIGRGWPTGADTQKPPSVANVARCDGPDIAYVGTAACVLASALTILQEKDKLPGNGGAFSTTAAFQDSGIYDRLAKLGVTFRIDETVKAAL